MFSKMRARPAEELYKRGIEASHSERKSLPNAFLNETPESAKRSMRSTPRRARASSRHLNEMISLDALRQRRILKMGRDVEVLSQLKMQLGWMHQMITVRDTPHTANQGGCFHSCAILAK